MAIDGATRAANRAEWNRYRDKLGRLGAQEMPEAVAATLNRIAGAAHSQQGRNLRQRFTLRNRYTQGGLRFYRASGNRPIERQNALVGTITPYMGVQEEGGTVRARRRVLAIPTTAGRGGNPARAVPRRFRLSSMGSFGSSGSRFFVARFSGKTGIFYRPSKRRLVMVRDLSRSSARIRSTNWHSDAVERFSREGLFASAFRQEAERRLARVTR